jgi:hypothetical protein
MHPCPAVPWLCSKRAPPVCSGGGYAYRLCPRPTNASEVTEQCFAQNPLSFVGNVSWIQYSNGRRVAIPAVRTTVGTVCQPGGDMLCSLCLTSGRGGCACVYRSIHPAACGRAIRSRASVSGRTSRATARSSPRQSLVWRGTAPRAHRTPPGASTAPACAAVAAGGTATQCRATTRRWIIGWWWTSCGCRLSCPLATGCWVRPFPPFYMPPLSPLSLPLRRARRSCSTLCASACCVIFRFQVGLRADAPGVAAVCVRAARRPRRELSAATAYPGPGLRRRAACMLPAPLRGPLLWQWQWRRRRRVPGETRVPLRRAIFLERISPRFYLFL